MTKIEFARKQLEELKQTKNSINIVKNIKNSLINNVKITKDEQIEIVQLMKQIYHKENRILFESVDDFLKLISTIEDEINKGNN